MHTRTITLELNDLQIELLRRWIDQAPTNPYVPMVAGMLHQLPMDTDPEACDRYLESRRHKSAADPFNSADSSPAGSQVPESAGGFQLHAMTERGKERLPEILRRLLQTSDCSPHGESL